jgi:uncharacterized membrane protein
MKTFNSDLSGKEFPAEDCVFGKTIRPALLGLIKKDHPGFDDKSCLSVSELNMYRQKYIAEYLVQEIGEVTELEKTVLHAFKSRKSLVPKLEKAETPPTPGQRVADAVATFGGSWRFIISFGVFILVWIVVNSVFLLRSTFDPYPFILLNLILSCLAALQAPVIMMSQNRQEEKDRDRARKDYMINLKSELEIRMLHEKLDHLITHQQQELIEIQKIQVEMMNDIMDRLPPKA